MKNKNVIRVQNEIKRRNYFLNKNNAMNQSYTYACVTGKGIQYNNVAWNLPRQKTTIHSAVSYRFHFAVQWKLH